MLGAREDAVVAAPLNALSRFPGGKRRRNCYAEYEAPFASSVTPVM